MLAWKDIITSYIIYNCVNPETFFDPIIDFIEIGKPRGSPSKIHIWKLNKNTKILVDIDV